MFKIKILTSLLAASLISSEYSLVEKMAINTMSKKAQKEFENTQRAMKEENKKVKALVYLTSSSVDALNQISVTDEVSLLRKQGLDVVVMPITKGLDNEVFAYAKKLKKEIENMAPMHKNEFKQSSVPLRVNPSIFDEFNITKVPTILFGECNGKRASLEKCEFYYKVTGETSLAHIEKSHSINTSSLFEEKK